MCTVSTNYAKCLQTMHSVYRRDLGKYVCASVSTNYAKCLQTIHGVYMYIWRLQTNVYARIHIYVNIWSKGSSG